MKTAIKYIYNNEGLKYGVAVAYREDLNTFPIVGVARCNMKADCFSKKKAVVLATARASKWGYVTLSDNSPDNWIGNEHLDKYLDSFSSMDEEAKFMDAITFVIKQVTPKEPNVESNGGN